MRIIMVFLWRVDDCMFSYLINSRYLDSPPVSIIEIILRRNYSHLSTSCPWFVWCFFCKSVTEMMSSCDRDCMDHNVYNICYLICWPLLDTDLLSLLRKSVILQLYQTSESPRAGPSEDMAQCPLPVSGKVSACPAATRSWAVHIQLFPMSLTAYKPQQTLFVLGLHEGHSPSGSQPF